MTQDPRHVCCFACDGEGRRECGSDWDGDWRWHERCETCEGTGGMEIDAEPIALENLDDMCGGKP